MISEKGMERLATCHKVIQEVVVEANKEVNFSVLCGHRGEKEQNEAFNSVPKRSKLKYPKSRHNKMPSLAVDLLPLPTQWSDIRAFKRMAAVIQRIARVKGAHIIWGGDWNENGRSDDEKFFDGAHFELRSYHDESGRLVEV